MTRAAHIKQPCLVSYILTRIDIITYNTHNFSPRILINTSNIFSEFRNVGLHLSYNHYPSEEGLALLPHIHSENEMDRMKIQENGG